MRQRGSNYICTDEDFISSVVVVPLEKQEEFRTETHLGKLLLSNQSINLSFNSFALQERPSYGWNDARCIIEISGGRKKLLEILYNVMQRPVGHNQRAYSTGMLR